MIFFGHLGLTTAVVKTFENKIDKDRNIFKVPPIDYRVVLIGSILPDIIDKPIGAFFFRSTFHNSRIFAHTLAFTITLLLIGTYRLYKYRKENFLLLGTCSLIHLFLDSMWMYPAILFWPYFGLKFPQRPEGNWLQSDLINLITDPKTFLPELIGFIIIAYYFSKLIKKKELKAFFTEGKL